jgi:diacylglycerol kinase (ATP)
MRRNRSRLINALFNSADGLIHALKTEEAVRQEFLALLAAVPLACLIATENWKRIALVALVFAVIAVELLNTCVEKLCDHVTPDRHPQIKIVKDMGSAAVLFALLATGLFLGLALMERLGWA